MQIRLVAIKVYFRKSIVSALLHILKSLQVLVIIAALFVPYAHPFVSHEGHDHDHGHHDHDSTVCTAELEKDPCHRRLVHHDVTSGCDHEHFTEWETRCELCDWITSVNYYEAKSYVSAFGWIGEPRLFSDTQSDLLQDFFVGRKGRSPPATAII